MPDLQRGWLVLCAIVEVVDGVLLEGLTASVGGEGVLEVRALVQRGLGVLFVAHECCSDVIEMVIDRVSRGSVCSAFQLGCNLCYRS